MNKMSWHSVVRAQQDYLTKVFHMEPVFRVVFVTAETLDSTPLFTAGCVFLEIVVQIWITQQRFEKNTQYPTWWLIIAQKTELRLAQFHNSKLHFFIFGLFTPGTGHDLELTWGDGF